MTTTTNQYLEGNFAPVHEEITTVDLPVTGTIPAELDGRLLRNGPNPVDTPDPASYHWFLGDGMVHGLRIRNGAAEWYRNRFVRSPEVAAALGEAPPPSPYPDTVGLFAANTNVIGHAGKTLAIVEAGPPPVELTDELETVGATDFSGTLEHPFGAQAPKRDPGTGELHVVAYHWAWGNQIRYMSVSPDGRVQRSVDVPTPGSPMVHDMAFTEKYALLFDLPVTFDLDLAMAGRMLPYAWNEEYGARIGLLPLDPAAGAADVRWFEIEPCYFYHPLNAYDLDDGRVVLDAVRHPKTFATDLHGPAEGATRLDRWTIDPAENKVVEETLSDHSQEFPRLNEAYQGRRNRYGYGAGVAFEKVAFAGAIKHDLVAGTTVEHDYGKTSTTLEPVFVAREGATAEDDGWVMSYVHDAATDRADVVILDAQDFAGDPVATIHLPVRVPYGFHGNWIPTT